MYSMNRVEIFVSSFYTVPEVLTKRIFGILCPSFFTAQNVGKNREKQNFFVGSPPSL